MALVVLLGAAVFVIYEAFKVREIVVEGCESLSAENVAALSQIEYEKSVFLLDKQAVMEALASDPYIKPQSVEVSYPDKIIITIEERKPAASIGKDGGYLVIDKEGWLLEVRSMQEDIVYPLVYGLPADTAYVGQRIGTGDTFKLDALSRVLAAAAEFSLELKNIDVSLAAAIIMELHNGLKIELGDDAKLNEKFKLILAFIENIYAASEAGGILDVTTVENAYYREN